MEQLLNVLIDEGLEDQFHPSYTRMVPAHYVVEIALVGCQTANTRFFTPRNALSTDPERNWTSLHWKSHRSHR